MRKKKTGDEKRMQKLRAALRLVWSRDYTHKDAIDKACEGTKTFLCAGCLITWPKFAARVDHDPQLGEFHTLEECAEWMIRLFKGNTRVLCKPCHDKVTAAQRKRAK